MSAPAIDDQEPKAGVAWTFAHPVAMLALLAACHFLVDIVAGTTSPTWPSLETHLELKQGALLWVYVTWSIATSFSQLLFGMWADRYHSRWLIWIGPLIGIVCISSIGLASSPVTLAMLFALGGLGIAAFHPEAAATAGALLPEQRSRAMAIFALCGYLGQAVGPYYSGRITDHLGPRGLVWGMAWGLPVLFVLFLGLRRVPPTANTSPAKAADKFDAREKLPLIFLLLAVGALRILPALGVPLALAYLLKSTDASNAVIGAVQSAFMAGIGVGAMGCAAFVSRSWERRVLWIFPLCATPFLAAIVLASDWILVGLVATSGLLLGVTMPVYISYGQQLLPHGQRVASAITMGVSWGIGGGIVAAALWICLRTESLPMIFGFFSLAALASSVLCYFLPAPNAANSNV
ncbi:MAG: MFS transporter [Planctomycetaceae bacterium]|nr:MFS transporter [Planctomycetales bacterium]MCB9937730.1 MFS transporter [Planctomycetaceae bacterium]